MTAFSLRQIFLIGIWLVAVGFGFFLLESYENTPGKAATVASYWPTNSRLERSSSQDTLILFLHPECPCSAASVEELEVILARAKAKPHTIIAFLKMESEKEISQSRLWAECQSIPTAHLAFVSQRDAQLFGATTSGFTALYDRHGSLLFEGGITAERNHSGDNFGVSAITSLLDGKSVSTRHQPTFGCALFSMQESRSTKAANGV
ncbi:MAG TPA: hypothetical protein V6C97_07540 [Oculatellaceae cyanobacterium]